MSNRDRAEALAAEHGESFMRPRLRPGWLAVILRRRAEPEREGLSMGSVRNRAPRLPIRTLSGLATLAVSVVPAAAAASRALPTTLSMPAIHDAGKAVAYPAMPAAAVRRDGVAVRIPRERCAFRDGRLIPVSFPAASAEGTATPFGTRGTAGSNGFAVQSRHRPVPPGTVVAGRERAVALIEVDGPAVAIAHDRAAGKGTAPVVADPVPQRS
ncbi:hypothetical protein [Rhizosaccharibacter radicis]|uniref:Flagella basal body P-ring formation protein FlgA C-terminal domain-containing protein n=1 Tax=Rhizosaccharibacter radicis TaxID=2782605 RepID=A0ABT1W0X6_9PROT|nr:hypothetical protein [Acetobacteraceae bacterium KSS12]